MAGGDGDRVGGEADMVTGKENVVGECKVLDWTGCYDNSWRGLIVDEAFAHP